MSVNTIEVKQLYQRHEAGETLEVVDCRTPAEFRDCHASIATNLPLESLDPAAILASRQGNSDRPLYVICGSGNRSRQACEKLSQAGVNVVDVLGGTGAWRAAGLPVVRGKKAISLERQVRIVAGVLVVTGVALTPISPWFAALSGFIGAGLVFSGVTDTCPMSMVIAKMPWNQVAAASCATSPQGR